MEEEQRKEAENKSKEESKNSKESDKNQMFNQYEENIQDRINKVWTSIQKKEEDVANEY